MAYVALIGTGTPNPDPFRSGPCVGVVHKDKVYLVDFGVGLIRQINKLGFDVSQLNTAFLTHLHSDHTLGLSDLILTPWILGRHTPLELYGPKGLKAMCDHTIKAFELDIKERINGLEKANTTGYMTQVTHIEEGVIYKDDIKVEALRVPHGNFEAYAFKFTSDNVIVISGDTAPSKKLEEFSKDCDILVHEVYYTKGLETRSDQWKQYHSSVHTSALALGQMADRIKPKKLVLYHQLFMQEDILNDDMSKNNELYREKILNEIQMYYNGTIVYGEDLMIVR